MNNPANHSFLYKNIFYKHIEAEIHKPTPGWFLSLNAKLTNKTKRKEYIYAGFWLCEQLFEEITVKLFCKGNLVERSQWPLCSGSHSGDEGVKGRGVEHSYS